MNAQKKTSECPAAISMYANRRLHDYNMSPAKSTSPWYIRWTIGESFKIQPIAHYCDLRETSICDTELVLCRGTVTGAWIGDGEGALERPSNTPQKTLDPNELAYYPKSIIIFFSFSGDARKCVIMDIGPDGNMIRRVYEFLGEKRFGVLGTVLAELVEEKIDRSGLSVGECSIEKLIERR